MVFKKLFFVICCTDNGNFFHGNDVFCSLKKLFADE